MVEVGKQRCLRTPQAWRAWLEKHHATEQSLWLVLYKKHTGKANLVYEDAVREALCFGWIDGIRKRVDDEKHMIRFTPRRPNSMWSPSNKKRVAELIADGRMTAAGLALVREAKRNGQWAKADVPRPVPDIPAELVEALARNKTAQRQFEALAPSHRKQYIGWIASAKRDVTRSKRAAEAVRLLAQKKKLGLK
jgi:uncharacterized protein YdeI (YjbR/CyaY-like superfamily)